MEPPWDEGTKVCSNDSGHMTKIAAMPVYGKNLKNPFLRNQKADNLETWCAALCAQVPSHLFKWWPWIVLDLFYCKVKFGPLCLCMGKTMDFSETIVVYYLKLATDEQSDKKFLLTSKLCPLGVCMPSARGYIHVVCPRPAAIYIYYYIFLLFKLLFLNNRWF